MFPTTRRRRLAKLELDIPLPLTFSRDAPLQLPQREGLCKPLSEDLMSPPAKNIFITDGGNDRDINSKLVETTIKFFLFQRGQVPIPYDKIQTRDNNRPLVNCLRNENEFDAATRIIRDPIDISDNAKNGDDASPLQERIRLRKMRRKLILDKKKADSKLNKIIQTEGNILRILEPTFEILRTICASETSPTSPMCRTSEAVVLMFGSSILNPKEIIIIEFVKRQREIESMLGKMPTPEDIIAITRSFYKSLIMSTAFIEFTEKRLRSTHSHICLLTTETIHDDLVRDANLSLLENAGILKSVTCPAQISRRPILHMRLNFQSQHLLTEKVDSVFDENTSDHFCYQLPLRFKGVSIL